MTANQYLKEVLGANYRDEASAVDISDALLDFSYEYRNDADPVIWMEGIIDRFL